MSMMTVVLPYAGMIRIRFNGCFSALLKEAPSEAQYTPLTRYLSTCEFRT